MTENVEKWNLSHQKIPKDKTVSAYAVDKEKDFPAKCTLLDLGGGTCTDAIYFAEQGHVVSVVDISDVALEIGQQKAHAKNLTLVTKQAILPKDSLPFPDNSFDVVYSRLSIHYFEPKDTYTILYEIKRVLKKGCRAYITVKSPKDVDEMTFLRNTAKEVYPNVFVDEGDTKSRYTFDQWKNLIEPVGFNTVIVHDYIENLGNRVDVIKSGTNQFTLTELILEK